MPPKHVAPAITLKAFSCPLCGALADQEWFEASADLVERDIIPSLVSSERLAAWIASPGFRENQIEERILTQFQQAATGRPLIHRTENPNYCNYKLVNIHVSRCFSCKEIAIWRYDTLLYPPIRYEIEPNADIDDDIRADFEEARTILDFSPRGAAALLRLCIQKLCKQLGKPGKILNDDIASLVKDGLDAEIQRALDIVRVIGNEAVHPGTMDLKDDRETAAKLFELVNLIAYERITRPKTVQALFSGLPHDKIEAIEKRDRTDTK